MYVIKMNKDKTLSTTLFTPIYVGEQNIDTLSLIIPKMYDKYDISEYSVVAIYTFPDNTGSRIDVSSHIKIYDGNYYIYSFPFGSPFTDRVGNIRLKIVIEDAERNIILITSSCNIPVFSHDEKNPEPDTETDSENKAPEEIYVLKEGESVDRIPVEVKVAIDPYDGVIYTRLIDGELKAVGLDDGKSGIYVGAEDDMPEGTKVRVDPEGEAYELVEIDPSLSLPGYAADAAKVGEEITKVSENKADKDEIPKIFDWANAELPFTENEISGVISGGGFVVNPVNFEDGKTYFRYNANATNGFTWTNPNPMKGAVTITAKGYAQYGGTGGTRLLTYYDDGTNGDSLFIVVSGESRTVTWTSDPNKTLVKITGNYDMENWVLLDLDVMSIIADYPAPEGTVKTVNGVAPDETGNVPLTPEDIGAVAIDVTDEEVNLVAVTGSAAVGQTIVVDSVDEDGYPVSWHAVDLPEGGGGTVTSVNGIEPDENGNVEMSGGASSWNDLTDKPFGEEGETDYLVEPIDLQIVYGELYLDALIKIEPTDFVIGDTLYVIWNGETYEQTVREHRYTGEPHIGDGSDGTGNGEPFAIYCESDGTLRIACNDYSYTGTFSFAVVKSFAAVKTLDPKYLPTEEIERIAKDSSAQSDWNQNDETQRDYIKNRPFYQSVEGNYLIEPMTLTFNADSATPNESYDFTSICVGNTTMYAQWGNNVYRFSWSFGRWSEMWEFYASDVSGASDAPFIIDFYTGQISRTDTTLNEEITFAVGNPLPEYVTIPDKYLPTLKGATDESSGSYGMVPAPPAGGQDYVLLGSGMWGTVGGSMIKRVEGDFAPYNAAQGWYFVSGCIYLAPNATSTTQEWLLIYVSQKTDDVKDVYYYGNFDGYNNPVYRYIYGAGASVKVKLLNRYYEDDYLILNSSDGSGKQFRVTVDDTGTLSATEITE